jgi:O-antigen ligase
LAFGVAALLAIVVVLVPRGEPRPPSPGRALLAAAGAYAAWSVASLAWSVHPQLTASELRTEIGWNLLTAFAFYVVAAGEAPYRALVAVALATFAVGALVAVGLALSPGGWDAGRWHAGAGSYSTYVVLVAPLLLTLVAPPPAGFARGWGTRLAALALVGLLVASARWTDNRMVWLALATVFAVASLLGALRWRATLVRAPLRWAAPLVALLLVLGALFVDVARERATQGFPPHTSVEATLRLDPRLALWDHTSALIAERPLAGYGFGKTILEAELRAALNDPLLAHAHNVFMSQWLQTGAIGLAAFVALLAALAARFASFLRAADDALAFVGLVGLALLAGYVVKNLTDDFYIRSNAKEFWAYSALLLGYGGRLAAAGDARR